MPECVHCGSETDLFVSNVPICVKCDSTPQKTTDLFKAEVRLNSAIAKWRAAKLQSELLEAAAEFNEALSEYSKATGKK